MVFDAHDRAFAFSCRRAVDRVSGWAFGQKEYDLDR
jgi:hypothetical protein